MRDVVTTSAVFFSYALLAVFCLLYTSAKRAAHTICWKWTAAWTMPPRHSAWKRALIFLSLIHISARRRKLDGVVQQVIHHMMDQVGVGVDQHLFVHGQAVDVDHAVVAALLCRERHAGDRLPDVERCV